MNKKSEIPLVKTIQERCRVCYTCVRDCPAKAIRIYNGQAEVIPERCIGCGNCVRVCSQKAKEVRSSILSVKKLLTSPRKIAAAIAPSFPAEFNDIKPYKLIGMLRELGFEYVVEVSFGADLVSREYKKLVGTKESKPYIATTCPAVVQYVEKYHPGLVKYLAPISSPMVAVARSVHKLYGDEVDIVFIGPCLAKKEEALRDDVSGDVKEVLTFSELRQLFQEQNVTADKVRSSEFDPPLPGKGALYPIGRGMLQASGITEDLLTNDIVAADGTKQFVQAIKEFEKTEHNIRLLELLCCNGCVMGSGMTTEKSQFSRRRLVSTYANNRNRNLDKKVWKESMDKLSAIDLVVEYESNDLRLPVPTKEELRKILEEKGMSNPEDELNCGACGYETCIEHAVAIYKGLAETAMCLPQTIEKLKSTAKELSESYENLSNTQNALAQSQKLASLGRLAAGIAHEINNPLTGVLTYSTLMLEELDDSQAVHKEDLTTIINETMRCRDIVRRILDFARETKLEKESTSINRIIKEALYILEKHVKFHNITIIKDLAANVPDLSLDVSQMRSVINNFAVNAADAMPDGGALTITSSFNESNNYVKITFADTGTGISEENLKRIFDPFFTTKKAGEGTGLGLSVTYSIIERHQGSIDVESTLGKGTMFTVKLPVS